MCYVLIVFALVLTLIFLLQKSICSLLTRKIIKVTCPTVGVHQWSVWVTDMVIELLNHHTAPKYITVNILTIFRLVSLNNNIVGSLPGADFVHKCRSVLAVETKTIVGYRISKAVKVLEHHSDDTSR